MKWTELTQTIVTNQPASDCTELRPPLSTRAGRRRRRLVREQSRSRRGNPGEIFFLIMHNSVAHHLRKEWINVVPAC